MVIDLLQDLRSQTYRILMYHSVSDTPTYPWAVSTENFQRQMEAVAQSGLEVIGLDQIIQLLNEGKPVAGKLVITFDDGYVDNLEVAAPIMTQYGFTGTIFVSTGFVGKHNDWDSGEGIEPLSLLDWEGLKKLSGMGHILGGHTHKHVNLTDVDDPVAEVEEPIRLIRQKTGQAFVPFAYPYGEWNAAVREAVIRAGYNCSCIAGGYFGNHPGTDCWLLKREPVLWKMTIGEFRARLYGARCGGYWKLGVKELLSARAVPGSK